MTFITPNPNPPNKLKETHNESNRKENAAELAAG